MTEPWLEAARRDMREEHWRERRPVCAECGRHILEERYFPLPDGSPLCPGCVREAMVEIGEDE